jgi:sulfotransferase
MKKYNQFVCLSGLPRSGSTLLCAILSQNPKIHAEGNSAVCQLMWDIQQSGCKEQIKANNREQTMIDLISLVPQIYYSNIDSKESIIVDKCRSWTLPNNIELLTKYIDSDIKIIVLERPILEIVNSFAKLYKKNNIEKDFSYYLDVNSEPIMRSLNGVLYAKQQSLLKKDTFLFIKYNDLIQNTKQTIQKIYDICGWNYFEHDFLNIVPKYKENDYEYNLVGFHDVYPTIRANDNTIVLPLELVEKCNHIDSLVDNLVKSLFN